MARAVVAAGHHNQVVAYAQCAQDGREETNGVLAGGDWNEVMDGGNAITSAMAGAGLRVLAHGRLDALFGSGQFGVAEIQVLHPPKPADHPWLLVTVVFHGQLIRVLVANTHVGDAIHLLAEAKRRWKPHLVLTQENQSPTARARLRKAFPAITWASSGFEPPATGRGSAGTQVLARRTTFSKRGSGNQLVSPYLDRWHPERRCTWMDLRHRRAKMTFRAISGHTWTLGG